MLTKDLSNALKYSRGRIVTVAIATDGLPAFAQMVGKTVDELKRCGNEVHPGLWTIRLKGPNRSKRVIDQLVQIK